MPGWVVYGDRGDGIGAYWKFEVDFESIRVLDSVAPEEALPRMQISLSS